MRIIAGTLGARTIYEPPGHKIHPMSEKIRGALFNALGDIEGLTFLDAFAGSGALSFEAASRGAKHVLAIEKDKSAQAVAEKNRRELGLGKKVKIVHANSGGWSDRNVEKKFDIVLLDPPYDYLQSNLLQKLVKRHLKKNGLAVLSYPGHTPPLDFDELRVVANKNYGDAQLIYYRKL